MADKKFTLFELHLDEGSIQFGPSEIGELSGEIGTGGEPEAEPESEPEPTSRGRCPGGKAGKLLAALVVVVLVVAVAKKLFGGGSPSELDELDELAE
jgi:hypothetical protein